MAAVSDYLELELLDHVLVNATAPTIANVYAALYTTATTDAGGGTEVSGGGYTRMVCSFAVASSGASSIDTLITFPTATADWGTITHVAITDSVTTGGGNFLFHGALTASKVVNDTEVFTFPVGSLTVTLG